MSEDAPVAVDGADDGHDAPADVDPHATPVGPTARLLRRLPGTRWLQERPLVADGILGVLLVPASLVSLSSAGGARDVDGWLVVLSIVACLSLAFRRREPGRVYALVVTIALVLAARGYNVDPIAPPLVVAIYSVAAHTPRRVSVPALLAFVVALVPVVVWDPTSTGFDDYVSGLLSFGIVWLLGDNLQTRRKYIAELEARAERLEHEREARAREAVRDEQARIARELHDVVAHHVSVMTVQAAAARRVLDSRPDLARGALTAVEDKGREALGEMRTMLGVLRDDDADLLRGPQPSVERLPELVEHARATGLDVTLEAEGEPRPLAPGVDLAVYRIVQEALTNVIKHAGPAHAEVVLAWSASEIAVRVVDDGRGAAADPDTPPGQGLVGMRERVALYGGDLHAGPRPGGGFEVCATLPVELG